MRDGAESDANAPSDANATKSDAVAKIVKKQAKSLEELLAAKPVPSEKDVAQKKKEQAAHRSEVERFERNDKNDGGAKANRVAAMLARRKKAGTAKTGGKGKAFSAKESGAAVGNAPSDAIAKKGVKKAKSLEELLAAKPVSSEKDVAQKKKEEAAHHSEVERFERNDKNDGGVKAKRVATMLARRKKAGTAKTGGKGKAFSAKESDATIKDTTRDATTAKSHTIAKKGVKKAQSLEELLAAKPVKSDKDVAQKKKEQAAHHSEVERFERNDKNDGGVKAKRVATMLARRKKAGTGKTGPTKSGATAESKGKDRYTAKKSESNSSLFQKQKGSKAGMRASVLSSPDKQQVLLFVRARKNARAKRLLQDTVKREKSAQKAPPHGSPQALDVFSSHFQTKSERALFLPLVSKMYASAVRSFRPAVGKAVRKFLKVNLKFEETITKKIGANAPLAAKVGVAVRFLTSLVKKRLRADKLSEAMLELLTHSRARKYVAEDEVDEEVEKIVGLSMATALGRGLTIERAKQVAQRVVQDLATKFGFAGSAGIEVGMKKGMEDASRDVVGADEEDHDHTEDGAEPSSVLDEHEGVAGEEAVGRTRIRMSGHSRK